MVPEIKEGWSGRRRTSRRGRYGRRRKKPIALFAALVVLIAAAAAIVTIAATRLMGDGEIVTEGEKENPDTTPILGGAELTMLANQTEGQMMSFLLETAGGQLIVVDGGRWEDGEHLFDMIREKGGHVSAWFLTHGHTDHVGALMNLLYTEAQGTDTGIEVDHFYYNFADIAWYRVHELGDIGTIEDLLKLLEDVPQEKRTTVKRGDVITVDDVTVTVMNDRYEPGPDQVGERDGNDASVAYRMVVNGVSILFLGDLQQQGGDHLLAQAGDSLKSDIVQMAHHGQNGVSEEVYRVISPEITLWTAPDWLWTNANGYLDTPTTKEWMKKLKVKKYYCIKDGDQVIR